MNKHNIINGFALISKYFFATIFVIYGIQHFMYANYVAGMVPGWIPFHLFWVYFTGSAFFAFAISVFFNWNAKWGCFLLGIMIWIFIFTIHVPSLINDHFSGGDITSTCGDLGLASCAFMLSGILSRNNTA